MGFLILKYTADICTCWMVGDTHVHKQVHKMRPHLSAPQKSSSFAFRSSFYWSKCAIILRYTILLFPHLTSSLISSVISSRSDVCGKVRSNCIRTFIILQKLNQQICSAAFSGVDLAHICWPPCVPPTPGPHLLTSLCSTHPRSTSADLPLLHHAPQPISAYLLLLHPTTLHPQHTSADLHLLHPTPLPTHICQSPKFEVPKYSFP